MNKIFKILLIMGIIFNHSASKQDNEYEYFKIDDTEYQYTSKTGYSKGYKRGNQTYFSTISKEEYDEAKGDDY